MFWNNQTIASDGHYVKVGLEIGEHETDYENFTHYIQSYFELADVDFVVLYTRKNEVSHLQWLEWAKFFAEHDISFIFLYTQQKGAPQGKDSHLTRELVDEIRHVGGSWFAGDMLGETGSAVCWLEGYFADSRRAQLPETNDLTEAQQQYVNYVKGFVERDRELGVPAVLEVDQTILFRDLFAAGVDCGIAEVMTCNPEVMLASLRGASRAYGRESWGSHIAHEWFGGYRHDDERKYKRLKLAFYHSYLSGADLIYLESGHLGIHSYGEDHAADSTIAGRYRAVWKEFADFAHLHARPARSPLVRIAIVQGHLDGWTGWGSGATVWNQFGQEEWQYGEAEAGWGLLEALSHEAPWHDPTIYGDKDDSHAFPGGQYDILPAEASLEIMETYDCLIFLGWHTMDETTYSKLLSYVRAGGRLFMSTPHLRTDARRGSEPELFRDGDVRDLFGCSIVGRGRQVNGGVKFVGKSTVQDYRYPFSQSGICDPLFASGSVTVADVLPTDARTLAVIADKFIGWREDSPPILLENACGLGTASLLASWHYPGAVSLRKFVLSVLRTMLSGENKRMMCRVVGTDRLKYAVYPMNEGHEVMYALNTDFVLPQKIAVHGRCVQASLEIGPCEMRIVHVLDGLVCSLDNHHYHIQRIEREEQDWLVCLQGSGDACLQVFWQEHVEAVILTNDVPGARKIRISLSKMSAAGDTLKWRFET